MATLWHLAALAARRSREFAKIKPCLLPKHRKLRLLYARKYGNLTEEDWDDVLSTDEAKIPFTKEVKGLPDKTNFVQDNGSAHRAKATKKCIKEQLNLISLGHPPQRPDLNPIENI
ncbi:Tc1like transporase [Phytophthora palmivora]|uniref:Tc1like transporase n=1 Tax=Phytophthora palmivora TaxID=4796 RepID=A0A2P4XWC9_9STRA|nr:Tc1like transporase [Phytophthora palmivora]